MLAGHTKSKHHGLATFIKVNMSWLSIAQCEYHANFESITTKVHETTVVYIY